MGHLTITEPHPTVVKNDFIHAGRGGAGNYFRAPTTTPATGIATKPKSLPPKTARFHSGRGGAGNAHHTTKTPAISFDDEYVRQLSLEQKKVGHVGRGGAGNVYGEGNRKTSDAGSMRSSSSSSSASSSGSHRSGILGRLSKTLSRNQ